MPESKNDVAESLYWRQYGPAAASPTPLLLLHGFLGSGEDWHTVATTLRPRRKCWCPDLPGHGRSGLIVGDGRVHFADTAQALMRELDAQRIERCALAGYSMGGRLALYLAIHYPARFSCLVLESASPGLSAVEARKQRRRADENLAKRLESIADNATAFEAFLQQWYAHPLFESLSQHPDRLKALIACRLRHRSHYHAHALRGLGLGAQPSLWASLSQLSVPVLVLAGALDQKFCAVAEQMGAQLPDASVTIMPGCGHNIHFEQPEGYAARLNTFLKEHD